jgi:hypothetical protein
MAAFNEEELMRRYLLGDLDDQDCEPVEERLLTDLGFAARLADVETALIDDYVFELLSESDTAKFRKNFFFNDERRKQLLLATALKDYGPDTQRVGEERRSQLQTLSQFWRAAISIVQRHNVFVTVCAVLLFVVLSAAVIWLLRTPRLPEQRAAIERELEELNQAQPPMAKQSAMEIALQPTLLRDAGKLDRLTLTAEIKFVKLKLEYSGNPSANYRVSVRKVDGGELFVINNLRPEPPGHIPVIIPAELLPIDDYQIELYSGTADEKPQRFATYYFRILR